MQVRQILRFAFFAALLVLAGVPHAPAQPRTGSNEAASRPKTIFRDSDGDLISNDEFVDIRMANFHIPDRTIVKTLEDGTVEFRLQKVPQEGAPVPPLAFTSLDGKSFSAEQLAGKVLVVNFWFIGCPACVYEMPRLNEIKAKFGGRDDIVFVSMTADPTGRVRKYLEREKFDYLNVADAGPLMKSIGFGGYPKNFVVGRDGRIVYWRSNIHAWWKIESVIREELAK